MRRVSLLRLVLSLFLMLQPALADASPGAPAMQASAAAQAPGVLVFMNRALIHFRSNLLGATPAERATRAARNIAEILAQRGPGRVTLSRDAAGNVVMLDGRMAFFIASEDADPLAGETLDSLSARVAQRVEQAVAEAQEAWNGRKLLTDAALALAETSLLGFVLWGLRRLRRRILRRLLRRLAAQAGRLRVGGLELVRRDRLQACLGALTGAVFWSLCLLCIYTWLSAVLGRFPYTRPWGEQLNGFLLGLLARVLGGILGAVPDLIIVAVVFMLARAASGMLSPLFERVQSGQISLGWLDRDTARPTGRLLTVLIWVFAAVMAYPYLPGAQTEAFKGISVLLGLMISLGSTSLVGQAAAGLILMYSRTIRRGEYVRIAEHEGTITELGMFTTRLRTGRGEEITLPNNLIVGTATRNFSRTPADAGFIIDTTVTIGYDTPWRQVEALLIEAARRTPGIVGDPLPRVFQLALADFYPEYCLVCHALPAEPRSRAELMSQLHASIQDVFNEYGVQIMSPHYHADPAVAKRVPKGAERPPPVCPDRP